MKRKVVIIGAGVGGLATAARLAHDGCNVEVYEKLSRCGGRNNIIEDRGFKIDKGPSFVMMPDFFAEVFSYCGRKIEDYLDLKCLDPSYKIFYADGDCLTVHKDSNRTKEELERLEKGSSKAFGDFISETGRIYNVVRPLLYKCVTKKALLDPAYWPIAAKIRVFDSYWGLAKKFFKSDKLCYALTFEAMFMGVSPFIAPAFYSVITYADHAQKIYHAMGGMYQIPRALEKLAREFGAQFFYGSEAEKITSHNGKISVRIKEEDIVTDSLVVNADYAYTQGKLLKRKVPKFKYSCSVYLIYIGTKKRVKGLAHHNLFFSSDLRKNLRQIFDDQVMPEDPSFYIHVPTVTDPSLAPAGKDILYILVPVPNLENGRDDISMHEGRIKKIVYNKIKQITGENVEQLIEVEHRFYPQDFIRYYNIAEGATFGLAHNLMQSAFFRPANFDSVVRNLYYVGASTQPGGGLPVVIAGSRIIADRLKADNLSG